MIRAVDFDSTLAYFDEKNMGEYAPDKLGAPVVKMLNRVKSWLKAGDEVVILTARVHPSHGLSDVARAEKAIKAWCLKYLGQELEVTCMKSPKFREIWDDKAVRVRRNTGELDFYDEWTVDLGAFL